MNDDELWTQVAREVKNGQLDEGLWLKARTLTQGPKDEAERAYVILRVEQLQAERQKEAKVKKEHAVGRQGIPADHLWKILHSTIPDMDHLPHSTFRGSKSDFSTPRSATFVAEKAKVLEFQVIDAIKAGKIPGIFDGKEWWVGVK